VYAGFKAVKSSLDASSIAVRRLEASILASRGGMDEKTKREEEENER
jgi:hypothetical protein